MHKLKNALIQVSLLLISTLVALTILELALRALNIPPKPTIPESCQPYVQAGKEAHDYSNIHGQYVPNSTHTLCTSEFQVAYHMDSNGYLGFAKPNTDEHPLLVIGDSFAFGFGVEPAQSFAGQLEAYNAGLWGNSFPMHAQAFEQIVDVVKPRRVIWVIYPPHLISVSTRRWNTRATFDEDAHPFLAQIVDFYNQTNLSGVILASTGWGVNAPDYYTLEWSLYDDQDSTLDMGYWAFEKAVKKITRIARERNVEVIPLFIPSKSRLQLEVDGLRPPLLHIGRNLQGDLPTRRMGEILSKYGIPPENQFDAFDIFRDGSVDWHRSYFTIDAHLNEQGHRYVADYLKQKLGELK